MMAPAVGSLTRIAEGRMTWDVGLREGRGQAAVGAGDQRVGVLSRNVASLGVRAEGGGAAGATREDEGFIFYRGLGPLRAAAKVETIADGMLRVSNGSAEDIPAAFLLHVHAAGGAVTELGCIPAGGGAIASPTPKERDAALYAEHAAGSGPAARAGGHRAVIRSTRPRRWLTPGSAATSRATGCACCMWCRGRGPIDCCRCG